MILIDTREPDEAALSPIPGTVNLPFSKIAEALAESSNPGQFQKVSRSGARQLGPRWPQRLSASNAARQLGASNGGAEK